MHPKRYTLETPPYGKGRMEEDEAGAWVKHEDFQRLVEFSTAVAEQLNHEHVGLQKFVAGFGQHTPCPCEGCRAARAILEAREEVEA